MPMPVPMSYTFDRYSADTSPFAIYKDHARLVYEDASGVVNIYPFIGLAGEVGEAMGKIKKVLRDNDGRITNAQRLAIASELGDITWYVNQCCLQIGMSFDSVARANYEKLKSRHERGQLSGSGDNR
jgi:NTP pyrophosphatase (non-canonical NTP hydrolase)